MISLEVSQGECDSENIRKTVLKHVSLFTRVFMILSSRVYVIRKNRKAWKNRIRNKDGIILHVHGSVPALRSRRKKT